MGIFWDNAIKVTRDEEWNESKVSDILLIQSICVEAGLEPIIRERDVAAVMERLEKKDNIPARQIVEFVLRCLDYGWLSIKDPYGYKKQRSKGER